MAAPAVPDPVDRAVGREDPEVSSATQSFLQAEGIAVRTGAECIRLLPGSNGVVAVFGVIQGALSVGYLVAVIVVMSLKPVRDWFATR